jgi:uncharacterized protein YyaL (SSP411 family)
MTSQPVAVPQMLVALQYSQAIKREVVIAGDPQRELTQAFLRKVRTGFQPNTVVLLVDSESTREALAKYFPTIASMREINDKPTAYVCQNYTCQLPTNEISKFGELLQ